MQKTSVPAKKKTTHFYDLLTRVENADSVLKNTTFFIQAKREKKGGGWKINDFYNFLTIVVQNAD